MALTLDGHALQNMPVPEEPVVFSKFASAISNPGDDIIKAPEVQVRDSLKLSCNNLSTMACRQELDFEVEMVIVIGKDCKRVAVSPPLPHRAKQPSHEGALGQEADAMQYVAGYTVAHDVSARDWQLKKNGGQWLVGKVVSEPGRQTRLL